LFDLLQFGDLARHLLLAGREPPTAAACGDAASSSAVASDSEAFPSPRASKSPRRAVRPTQIDVPNTFTAQGTGSIIPIENCGYQPLKLLRF
jgi:hypothetical protein